MQTELTVECSCCVYWVQDESDIGHGTGICHRFPRLHEKDADDFCGEFDPGPGDDDEGELDTIDSVADYWKKFYQNDTGGCFVLDIEEEEDDLRLDDGIMGRRDDYPYL